MVPNVCARWLLCVCVTAAASGCSGGYSTGPVTSVGGNVYTQTTRMPSALGSPPPKPHRWLGPGWLSKDAAFGKGIIYVAAGDAIVIFPNRHGNPAPIGMITDGISNAYGLFVDRALNLYVCNAGNSTVTVYPRGQTSPSFTYSAGVNAPLYAVADSRRLFVGNWQGGAVSEFTLGNDTLQYSLQTPGVEADGVALDASGNLYVAFRKSNQRRAGGIEYFAQGAGAGENLGMRLTAPQGLIIDPSGNILVVETQSANRIDAFRPGQSKRYAHVRHLTGTPTQIQLGARDEHIYVSELSSEIGRIAYPRFKRTARYLDDGALSSVQGLAVSPPAP